MTETTSLEAIAYHEAGHAVASHVLDYADDPKYATIIPKDDSLGHVMSYPMPSWFSPGINYYAETRARTEDSVKVYFVGHAAEKRFTGRENFDGCESDYQQALRLADQMVGNELALEKYLEYLLAVAHSFVEINWLSIEAVAKALLEQKTLDNNEIVGTINTAIDDAIAKRSELPGTPPG